MAFRLLFNPPPKTSTLESISGWLLRVVFHKLAKVEEWHEVGASGEPAFENSWVNFNTATYPSAAFYKDPQGRVHLKGIISTGTLSTAAFTLPAGYRPNKRYIYAIFSNGTIGRCDILADGSVYPMAPASNVYVSLAGISFRAEQ